MTWLAAYALLKFWLPILTAVGLLYRAWVGIKKGVKTFADTVLDNHMHHIQLAAESTADSVKSLCASQMDATGQIVRIAADLRDHQMQDIKIQNAILTGIEVLKAKVD